MSDLLRGYYDASYPPDILGGTPPVVPSTGATAGTPGQWTPSGSTPPANAAGAGGVIASPATDWTVGQYVQGSTAGTAGEMNWNGTAWVAGRSAVAEEPPVEEPTGTPEPSDVPPPGGSGYGDAPSGGGGTPAKRAKRAP